jgi:hypothetical protein
MSDKPTKPERRVRDDCPDAIYVAFFEHRDGHELSAFDAALSARLRVVSPRYEHCQFVFEWKTESGYQRESFSTTKSDPSSFVVPGYRNRNWNALALDPLLNPDASKTRRKLFRWVMKLENTPFNTRGYYGNFVPPVSCISCCAFDADGSAYFCAEQVATGLAHVGLKQFTRARPYLCTPDDVYDLLRIGERCTPVVIKMSPLRAPNAVRIRVDDEGDAGEKNHGGRKCACPSALGFLCGWLLCGCPCCCHYPESQRVLDASLDAVVAQKKRASPRHRVRRSHAAAVDATELVTSLANRP